MFSVNNFIDTTNTIMISSTVLKLVNSNKTVSHLIVSCQYQKMAIKDKSLIIVLHNHAKPIILDFASRQEAIQAQNILSDMIYSLKRNCGKSPGQGDYEYLGPTTVKINTGLPESFVWTNSSVGFYIPPQFDISKGKVDVFLNGQKLSNDLDYELTGRTIYIKEKVNGDPFDAEYNCGYAVCIQEADLIELVIH